MSLRLLVTPTANRLMMRKLDRVRAVIVHASGEQDLDRVLKYYHQSSDLACPHFLVETTGVVRQFADLDRVANHAAMPEGERAAYERGLGHWTRCDWDADKRAAVLRPPPPGTSIAPPRACFKRWRTRWPGYESPLDLATRGAPNQNSVGIELLSPLDTQRTRRIFLDVQYEQLALVLATVGHRLGVKLNGRNVLEHSDVNPLRRTTDRGGAYDPGEAFDWDGLWKIYTSVV